MATRRKPAAASGARTAASRAASKGRAAHLDLGAAGEEAAALHLAGQGFAILARNWRPAGALQGLELDIVARHRDTLVFVEVKTRTRLNEDAVPAHAAFTARKRSNMVRAARLYMAAHQLWELPCRFDLVCVEYKAPSGSAAGHSPPLPRPLVLEHHANVIELGKTVDSRDAAWQPW